VTSKAGLATASLSGNWLQRRRHATGIEAVHPAEFVAVALLDRNGGTVKTGEIQRRPWRCDVERNVVVGAGQGLQVSADLVGDIAIGGNAVGADDYRIDLALRSKMPAALSAISVCGTPCWASSQAVSRPWLRGRVSETQTCTGSPAS
jgi:hypothetical protein